MGVIQTREIAHDLKPCAAHYAVEKQGGQVEYQCGDFLKAIGSRPRAATNKNTNPMSHIEEGNGSAAKQSSGQAVQSLLQKQTAMREIRLDSPSNLENGYAVNQGMDVKNSHGNNLQHNCHANVKELNVKTRELSPKIMLTGKSNKEINVGG